MNLKKVLLTSYSGQLGGLELRLADEARFLNEFGYKAHISLNPFPEILPWLDQLTSEGIPFSFFSPPSFFAQWRGRRFNKLRANLFYVSYIKQIKADLVHVAFAWTDTGVERLWLAHKAGVPTVISVHNAFPYQEFSPWHEAILIEAFRSVKGIYAVSDSALECFLKIYEKFILPGTLTRVIYNPVDNLKFIPSQFKRKLARDALAFKDTDFVIGVVGRLSEQKRPEMLLEVFAILKNQFSNLKLVFIGQGNLEMSCKLKAESLNISDSVTFFGFCHSIEDVLPMLDLHVLLSTREGFGIATAEAMACGVPVVATDVPGSKDILRGSAAGMLVSPNNITEIVADLARLIVDSELQMSMAKHGPKEVAQRFSQYLIKKELKDFYKKII